LKKLIDSTSKSNTVPVNKDTYDKHLDHFILNSFIHKLETVGLFYNSLGVYNHEKDEAFKRNAAISSGGIIYRTDKAKLDYLNQYRKRRGEGYKDYDGTLKTAVLAESKVKSTYIDSYAKYIAKDLQSNNPELNEESALAKAYEMLRPYSEMTEADAQGWINIDSYRMLGSSSNNWSDQQESLYQSIIKGEKIDFNKIKEVFPPLKNQYWGTLKNHKTADDLNLPVGEAFHKYQLTPIIPELLSEDQVMKDMYDMMTKQGFDYFTFGSGLTGSLVLV
jgi:hypothetical protein